MSSSFASKLILNDALEPKYLQINFPYVLYVCDVGVMRQVGDLFCSCLFSFVPLQHLHPNNLLKGQTNTKWSNTTEPLKSTSWLKWWQWAGNGNQELAVKSTKWSWKKVKGREEKEIVPKCTNCVNREPSENYNIGMKMMIWLWE